MDRKPARLTALMSIHPRYADAILSNHKRVEFRKRPLSAETRSVVIYATSPVMAVVGEFGIEQQVLASPADLWTRFADVGGIDHDSFFAYYDGFTEAVGIMIGEVIKYDTPRALCDVDPGGCPPQSFKYLPDAHHH